MKNLSISVFFALAWLACEKQSIEFIESETAVVEAYIHAGKPVDSIRITQSFSYAQIDTNIITLDDLEIILSDFTSEYLLDPIGDGFYQNLAVIIRQDKSYRLQFSWNGEIISAQTYIPLKKEAQLSTSVIELAKIPLGTRGGGISIEAIEVTWDNAEGDYYYVVIENLESTPEYVNENFALTGGPNRSLFVTEPQINDFYRITQREITQYGSHRIIVFRVNPEYAALYESAGNSTLSLEQPPTNIENGLGIFTGATSDTLFLEVKKI